VSGIREQEKGQRAEGGKQEIENRKKKRGKAKISSKLKAESSKK